MLDMLPAAEGPESAEFDRELRRALFHRAAEQVRREVQPATWQAFWETGVVGTSPADAAKKLGMTRRGDPRRQMSRAGSDCERRD